MSECSRCGGTGRSLLGGKCGACAGKGYTSDFVAAVVPLIIGLIAFACFIAMLLH